MAAESLAAGACGGLFCTGGGRSLEATKIHTVPVAAAGRPEGVDRAGRRGSATPAGAEAAVESGTGGSGSAAERSAPGHGKRIALGTAPVGRDAYVDFHGGADHEPTESPRVAA
jgi:hypothetical protein